MSELDILHLRSVFALLAAALLAATGWLWYRTATEVERARITLAPGGAVERGRALVVVHPGFSAFPDAVAHSFGQGLADAGWRVELTTASGSAPTDLSRVDLLVLAAPVYWFAPARPVQRYVRRLGDLGGKPVAILLTAAGSGDRALGIAERLVTDAHGSPVSARLYSRWRPNIESGHAKRPIRAAALELAYRTGRQLAAVGPRATDPRFGSRAPGGADRAPDH